VPCPGMRSGRLMPVSITAGDEGVSVEFDGRRLFDRMSWDGVDWAPQPGWQLIFSSSSSSQPDNHWIDDLRVTTGVHVGDTAVPLNIALNGQQFVEFNGALPFTFESTRYPAPPPPPHSPDPPQLPPPQAPSPSASPSQVPIDDTSLGSGEIGSGSGDLVDSGSGSGSGSDEDAGSASESQSGSGSG
jgi:hypothetical protein